MLKAASSKRSGGNGMCSQSSSSAEDGSFKRQKQQPPDAHCSLDLPSEQASTAGKRKRPASTPPIDEDRYPIHNGHDAEHGGDIVEDHQLLQTEPGAEEQKQQVEEHEQQLQQQQRKRAVNLKAPNKRVIDDVVEDLTEDGLDVLDKKSRGGGSSSNFHGSLTPVFEGDLSPLILRTVDLAQWPLDCQLRVQRSSQRVTSELLISRHWEVLWLKAMIGQLVHLNVWEIHLTMHGTLLENHRRLIDYPGAATLEVGCRLKVHLVVDEHSDSGGTQPPFVIQAMASKQQIAARQITQEDVLRHFGDSSPPL